MFCRKNLGIVALVGVCGLLGSNNSFAGANNYWGNFQGKVAPSAGKQLLTPNTYQISTLDQGELLVFLSKLSEDPSQAKELSLPTPDGKEQKFLIWKTPILEAPLQAKFSEIQTYTAKSIDDGAITAKIDYTLSGFHAMIFDGDNSYVIDPYSNIADGYYLVYYKKDYTRPIEHKMVCEISDGNLPDAHGVAGTTIDGSLPKLALRQNGSNRKTYRLALSCTGEYAVAVSTGTPTTAGVLSAMVTTMNRVNGIYERELSATMVLIGNNDTLIYLSPSTDPFTANNNGGVLLGQNQNNTNSKVGSANYDIGHIFSTGGGGIASLGSVCSNWGKAQGVTGSNNPVGDPFDVDYVSHEMGHQFGANHTFNNCSGNENDATAFEPGSGSTIMAYAGICGNINNLQNGSNAYFHQASLNEMSDFIVNGGFGAGGSGCGANTAGAQPPTLPNIAANYAIPYQTPFELEAPIATISATDTLRYSWEQWNNGDIQTNENLTASITNGASFRSFSPTTSRTRVFPRIQYVIDNVSAYKGERLPTVARTLRFKAGVRSVLNGWGTFDVANNLVTLNVTNTGTPFELTYPNTSVSLNSNILHTITWNVAQTNISPINATNVNVYLSVDGGLTYPHTLATNVPNTGSASIPLLAINTSTARIKIKGGGNVFFDISNTDFTIVNNGPPPIVSVKDITLAQQITVFPNPATQQLTIKNTGQSTLNLSLFNAIGQTIWTGKAKSELQIPVAQYARGLYYLQINNGADGASTTTRITLQ